MFGFWRGGHSMWASGMAHGIRMQGVAALEGEVASFFSGPRGDGADVLIGVLPFDREGEVLLFQPDRIERGEGWSRANPAMTAPDIKVRRIVETPSAASYAERVRKALQRLTAPTGEMLHKVVLARGLSIEAEGPVDPLAIAGRLAEDDTVLTFLLPLSVQALSSQAGEPLRSIVGATPELLLSRQGRAVASHPLAGSARRHEDGAMDRLASEALLRSEKDRREHAMVVEAILDGLSPYCAQLSTPEGTGLRSTATMWHLGTRIEGVLKSDDAPSAAGLAALLHPTPAVGGDPRDEALRVIRELEPEGRGYYAGAFGWVDGRGDGEWHVTLRCAQIDGDRLTLHAGAGIVPGSDPAAEVAETAAKFRAMLRALGVDGQDVVLEKVA